MALCLLTSQAQAQTAADTAMFLIQGEENAPLNAQGEFHIRNSIPCGAAKDGCYFDRTFKQVDKCHYTFETHIKNYSDNGGDMNINELDTYDFGQATSIDTTRNLDGFEDGYMISGRESLTCSSPEGNQASCTDHFWRGDLHKPFTAIKRVLAAWAYFRSNFCAGRAF